MGRYFHCFNTQRHIHLLPSVLLLLLLSSTQPRYSVEGRAMSKLLEVSKGGESGETMMERAMIGSSPPRCSARCISCGHCVAVQVPAVPQDKNRVGHSSTAIASSSRGEYSSNYKPMNWKCKCGDTIFNP